MVANVQEARFTDAELSRRHGFVVLTPTTKLKWDSECMWWRIYRRSTGQALSIWAPDHKRHL